MPAPPPSGSAPLSTAASALNPGQYRRDPIIWNPNNRQFDISQQCASGFWDDTRLEMHYMGKAQSGGNTRHFIFNEDTNSWTMTNGNVDGANALGHIWTASFDHTYRPGTYYHIEQQPNQGSPNGTRTCRYYDRSSGRWSTLPNAPFDVWANSGTPNPGMGFHPNLIGSGRPGLFCWATGGQAGFAYFDLVNQSWTQVTTFGSGPYFNRKYAGGGLYIPGRDEMIFGTGENHQDCLIVKGGDAGNRSPELRSAPLRILGGAFNRNGAHMILDPRSDDTVMLLERKGSGVWTSSNGGQSWRRESFSHPFWSSSDAGSLRHPQDEGSWTPCSISRYGVVMGLYSDQNGGGSIMWRPG